MKGRIIARLNTGRTILIRDSVNLSLLTGTLSGEETGCIRTECMRIDTDAPHGYKYLIKADDIAHAMAAQEVLLDKINRMNEPVVIDSKLCEELPSDEIDRELDDDALKRLYARAAAHEMPTVILGSPFIDLDDYCSCGYVAVIELTPPKNDPVGLDLYLADEAEANGFTVLDVRKPSYVPLYHSAVRRLRSKNRRMSVPKLKAAAEAAVNKLCGTSEFIGGKYKDMAEAERELFDILGESFTCKLRSVYDGEKWTYEPAEPVKPVPDDPWDSGSIGIDDDDSFFERAIEEYIRDVENDPNDEEYIEDEEYCDDEDDTGDDDDPFGYLNELDDMYDSNEYDDNSDDCDIFDTAEQLDFVIGPDGKLHPAPGSPFGAMNGGMPPFGGGLFGGSPFGGAPFGGSPFGAPQQPKMPPVKVQNIEQFIGLDNIKKRFREIVSCAAFERRLNDSEGLSEGLNIVLVGPPGTAKTSVARALAKMLEEAGITPPNSFVELRKSDIVGEYVGHTEHQIDEIFSDNAEGATLMWDEIYALAGEQRTVYDEQAVTSILANMENYRTRIVNIFIGYEEPMMRFLDANQGLRSRITDIVYFDSLDNETLAKIFCSFADSKGISIAEDCTDMLIDYFARDKAIEGVNFGNGRTARNLFNSAFRNLATRMGGDYSEGEPLEMTRDDVGKAIEDSITNAERMSKNGRNGETHIGFSA